jgi:glycosyltransferase involved in cell wall biosynthesis
MQETPNDISVIIPCYNTSPEFIADAINSVTCYSGKYNYAIIIVDDGSTNENTLNFLSQINDEKIKILYQENKGPAAARNKGARYCDSEYILFLDSDDKLIPAFIDEGIQQLSADAQAGVVYGNAIAFGDASRENFKAKPFDSIELLVKNFIPMCVVMRKKAWEDVAGIDENLVQYEDWEFWVRVHKAGWKFIYSDKILFEYRISNTSLIAQERENNFKKAVEYIYKKHWDLVYKSFHQLYANRIIYHNDMRQPFRSFLKYSKKKLLD